MAISHRLITFNERYLLKNWDQGSGNWAYSGVPANRSYMNDHCIVKNHADGTWHSFGIKKQIGETFGTRLYHAVSPDKRNWTFLADIPAAGFADPSFATHAWGATPAYIWAPDIIANPTAGAAGAVHPEQFVMCVTLVNAAKQEQLLVFTYSDDLENWTHDTASIYDPLNATDYGATPAERVWYYDWNNFRGHCRDAHFFYNDEGGTWELAVSMAQYDAAGTGWQAATARLVWDPSVSGATPDFSAGWGIENPGSKTRCAYMVAPDNTQGMMEGPWVLKAKDPSGGYSTYIGTSQQLAIGGQTVVRVADLSAIPYDVMGSDTISRWNHSAGCGLEPGIPAYDYKLGWGSNWQPVADEEELQSSVTGKYVLSRFFSSEAEASSLSDYEHWLHFSIHNIGSIDFSKTSGADASPLVSWEDGLDPAEWPIQWGTAFANQPTFGDPKRNTSRFLSDIIVSAEGYKCLAKVAQNGGLVATAANAPPADGIDNTWWDVQGVASAADAAYYEPWELGKTYYYKYVGSVAPDPGAILLAAADIYTQPFYIDTWEDRQGPYKLFQASGDEAGSAVSMDRRGYIFSDTWVLSGERISLRVAGGGSPLEFVALVSATTGEVVFKEESGKNYSLTDRLWDTTDLQGQSVYLCIADMCPTFPSGWIAVDTISEYTREYGDPAEAIVPSLPIPANSRLQITEVLGLAPERQSTSLLKSELYDAVASKLRLGVEMLAPLESEMNQWALDCLNWLLPLAPDYALESVMARHTGTPAQGIFVHSLPTAVLKVARVSHLDDGDEFTQVTPQQFAAAAGQLPADDYYLAIAGATQHGGSFSAGRRVWADVMGEILAHRVDPDDRIAVDYVPVPAWGDDGTPAGITIPHGWQGMISTYCAIQVKAKEGDQQQAEFYWKMLKDELSRFRGFEAASKSIGG